jgi:hypothetical protein
LKQPFGLSLNVAAEVLACIVWLHNFFIDMRSPDLTSEQKIDEIIPVVASPLGKGYVPTVETMAPPSSVHELSQICNAMLCMILQNGFGRPSHNIEQHQQELHELNLMK